jgi:hypothetical protein
MNTHTHTRAQILQRFTSFTSSSIKLMILPTYVSTLLPCLLGLLFLSAYTTCICTCYTTVCTASIRGFHQGEVSWRMLHQNELSFRTHHYIYTHTHTHAYEYAIAFCNAVTPRLQRYYIRILWLVVRSCASDRKMSLDTGDSSVFRVCNFAASLRTTKLAIACICTIPNVHGSCSRCMSVM